MSTAHPVMIVRSKDDVPFAVETARGDYATVKAELAFAASRTARELESFGDYRRVDPLTGYVVAPEFIFEAPRICGPLERRKAFRLIRGGKP
jgi:hypothetical protein